MVKKGILYEQYNVLENIEIMNEEEESALRRAEIIFLISIPFTALSHFLIIGGLYYAATKDKLLKIPGNTVTFGLLSTFMVSAAITYHDYRLNLDKKIKKNEIKNSNLQLKMSQTF
ncbi:MAG: hypothetical protein OEZ22_09125 [Spirochaetia bacterium]|nr:hypothetical protein [Spirochaetia bacterium]